MSLSWYSIIITLNSDGSELLNAKFSVKNSTNTIHNFVKLDGEKVTNILIFPNDKYGADYKYVSNNFTFGGTLIRNIPGLTEKYKTADYWNIWYTEESNSNISFYNTKDDLWYDIVDNNGNYGNMFTFNVTSTSAPKIRNPINKPYYITIYDKDVSSNIFVADVLLDLTNNVITSIKNIDYQQKLNLLKTTGDNNYSDNKIIDGKFTMAGTSIHNIPALKQIYIDASQWQFWNYTDVNGINNYINISYKNELNEWITITKSDETNRFVVTLNTIKPY